MKPLGGWQSPGTHQRIATALAHAVAQSVNVRELEVVFIIRARGGTPGDPIQRFVVDLATIMETHAKVCLE